MKTHLLTHKELVLERVSVGVTAFCVGAFFGLRVPNWLPAGFLTPLVVDRAFHIVIFVLVVLWLIFKPRKPFGSSSPSETEKR